MYGINLDLTYRSACAREVIIAIDRRVFRLPAYKGYQANPAKFDLGLRVQKTDTEGREKPSTSANTIRKLTPARVEEYRKKNLCFKCDGPYSQGHKCKGRSLMMIECNDSEPESEGEEEILFEPKEKFKELTPAISLHAMEGSSSPTTIRLMGTINNKPVNILLDSGTTHNFVDSKVVQRTGHKGSHELSFGVTIAGDEELHTEGVCRSVHVRCQGTDIIADFYILPVGVVKWYWELIVCSP